MLTLTKPARLGCWRLVSSFLLLLDSHLVVQDVFFFFPTLLRHTSSFTTSFVSVICGSSFCLRPRRPITNCPWPFFHLPPKRGRKQELLLSADNFLDNSFPVLLWGNKSAPLGVLLWLLISGARNEMRWLSSHATSLSWGFSLLGLRNWRGGRRGPRPRDSLCRGNYSVFIRKKFKKPSVKPSTPLSLRMLVVSSKLACLTRRECGIGFAVPETQLPLVCLHRNGFHAHVQSGWFWIFLRKKLSKDGRKSLTFGSAGYYWRIKPVTFVAAK